MSRLLSLPAFAILLSLVGLAAPLPAADTPPEIVAARKRYDAATALAMKPVRDRYLQELQQLKDRALSLKNLELATALDAEIKAVTPVGAITPSDTAADWENRLIGTSWLWNKDKTITFQANGSVTPRFGAMKWKFTEPGNMEYHFENGDHGTITFERALTRGTIHAVGRAGRKTTEPITRVQ